MPKPRPDFTKAPDGYIDVQAAANILGCHPHDLENRRWVRRRGLPALQLRRGWPLYFHEQRLREWLLKASVQLKPDTRERERERRARGKRTKRRGHGERPAATA